MSPQARCEHRNLGMCLLCPALDHTPNPHPPGSCREATTAVRAPGREFSSCVPLNSWISQSGSGWGPWKRSGHAPNQTCAPQDLSAPSCFILGISKNNVYLKALVLGARELWVEGLLHHRKACRPSAEPWGRKESQTALQPAGQTHQFPRESRQGLRPSPSPSYWSKPPSRTGHWARGWRSGAGSNQVDHGAVALQFRELGQSPDLWRFSFLICGLHVIVGPSQSCAD